MKPRAAKLIVAVIAAAGVAQGWAQTARLPAPSGPDASSATNRGPRIQFVSTILDFGKVQVKQVINHEFVFTNAGDQVLEIRDVRPSCGCTVAGAWDRRVEPGKSGTIPIRFNTANYAGPIFKTVGVICNDPVQSNVILQITGTIWEPIDVTPAYVMFGCSSDCPTNQTRAVRIVNNLDQPLTVSEPECANRAFQTALKTVQPGKEFEVQITLKLPLSPGNLTVPVTVKTSSTNLPLITITVYAAVQPAVTATPAQITLPAGPLTTGAELKVAIQDNGTRPLALSKPSVNVPGVSAQIQELKPGRQFVLTANFPPGFRLPNGQNVEIQVKTDHPQFPVITLPVREKRSLAAELGAATNGPPAPAGSNATAPRPRAKN